MKAYCVMPKNTLPKVTVVIVNWNGERFLDRCLSALLAQTAAPHAIILVDNASSDASLDIVRRFPSVRLRRRTRISALRAAATWRSRRLLLRCQGIETLLMWSLTHPEK